MPGQVEDAELLFRATSCEDLGVGLDGECDGSDDVRMLKCVQAFACMCIPYLPEGLLASVELRREDLCELVDSRGEVRSGSCSYAGVRRKPSLPYCPLVSEKGTNPGFDQ